MDNMILGDDRTEYCYVVYCSTVMTIFWTYTLHGCFLLYDTYCTVDNVQHHIMITYDNMSIM